MPMRKLHVSADPGERQSPIGIEPQALIVLTEILDGRCSRLLDALRDEMPNALAKGKAADWAKAGHAIIDLLAGAVDARVECQR